MQRYKIVLGTSEAQKPAWKGCAGSLMAEMKQKSTLRTFGLLKQATTLVISSPVSQLLVLEAAIARISLENTDRQKLRLYTNCAVVWLYTSGPGVSLILVDVQFGTISLDWATI